MSEKKPTLTDAVRLLGQAIEASDDAPPDLRRLIAYERGELSDEERREVEDRLTWSRADSRLLLDWQRFSQGEAPPLDEGELDTAWRRLAGRLAATEEGTMAEPEPMPTHPPLPAPPPKALLPRAWRPYLAAASVVLAATAIGWGFWQGKRRAELEREIAGQTGWAPEALDLESDPLRASGTPLPRLDFPEGARRRLICLRLQAEPPGGTTTLRIWTADGRVVRVLENVPVIGGAASFALAPGELPPGRYSIEATGTDGIRIARIPFEVPPPGTR